MTGQTLLQLFILSQLFFLRALNLKILQKQPLSGVAHNQFPWK